MYTGFALLAFAMNSVLCRLALGGAAIDAASFSTIRLASGAICLLLITALSRGRSISSPRKNPWPSAILLFLYAVTFSFAYINLSAGTGALILFGSVQATMIIAALWSGERPSWLAWTGLLLALAGLVYLMFPGLRAPSLLRSVLMATAGISWGGYSLRGRGAVDPLGETASNFLRSLPFVIVINLLMMGSASLSAKGAALALLSGALASGIGYVVWYAALKRLTTTRAATVQLIVPVLAATGGIILLREEISLRLLLSAILILGGIGLTLIRRERSINLKGS